MSALSRQTLFGVVLGLGLLGWALAASPGRVSPAASSPAAKAPGVGDYRVSGPFTHENLAVFLLHGPDSLPDRPIRTLDEALAAKAFVVHETGEVNTLVVENLSAADDVLIQNGDIVKGGRQDRLIAAAVLVPAGSGPIAVPSFCVEHGRWSGRPGEAAGHFAGNDSVIATKDLKYAANVTADQGEVWKNVEKLQRSLSANVGKDVADPRSRTSLQLALEDRVLKDRLRGYEDRLGAVLRGTNGVVGFVTAVNGTVTGAEVFGSSAVMAKAWPKALRGAAVEAVAGQAATPAAAPTCAAAMAFLVDAERGKNDATMADPIGNVNADIALNAELPEAVMNESLQLLRVETQRVQVDPPGIEDAELRASLDRIQNTRPAPRSREATPMDFIPPPQSRASVSADRMVRVAPVSVNRVQGQHGVLVESRSKQNPGVVIHRSFIAK